MDTSCYQHLEYAGCGSIVDTRSEFMFFDKFPNVICKGFTEEEFNKGTPGRAERYKSLLMPNMLDESKLQYDTYAIDRYNRGDTEIDDNPQMKRIVIKDYQQKRRLMKQELQTCINKLSPGASRLFELWYRSDLSKFRLTTVGIAIAQANYRRRIGVQLDLSNWITK